MKIQKTKRFKSIIITKKKIVLFVCIFILILFGIYLLSNQKSDVLSKNQYSSSQDFHNMIVSDELHAKSSDDYTLKKLITHLLGFDIKKPETIVYNNSSQFYEVKKYVDQAEVIYPEPTLAPTPSPEQAKAEEKPIAEVSVAKGMAITNATSLSVDTAELINSPLGYDLDSAKPQVLIVHTHTTESYTDSGKTKYTATDSDRNTDEAKNMIAVGNALYDALCQRGIPTIHDVTVHDYPAYSGSYERSKATIQKNLKENPSIKIVLDLHRDGIIRTDGTKVKVACDIAGAKASQCMFVVGTNALLQHDNWRENMKLACKLQNKANELYPGLMRPINLREQRFNQQLSKGALIVEIGSNGNTLNESIYSAKLLANVIASLFKK